MIIKRLCAICKTEYTVKNPWRPSKTCGTEVCRKEYRFRNSGHWMKSPRRVWSKNEQPLKEGLK